jgi:bacterioferritin
MTTVDQTATTLITKPDVPLVTNGAFLLDLEAIKRRAREHLDDGAVTVGNRGDRQLIISLLNDALATELVCVLRYRSHHFQSAARGGIAGFAVTAELLQHSQEELAHADRLASRITQLGGEPDFAPHTLASRSHTDYVVSSSLKHLLTEDLVAERIAIETYTALVRFVADRDPTTRRLFEDLHAQEEAHADELSDLLRRLPPRDDRPVAG